MKVRKKSKGKRRKNENTGYRSQNSEFEHPKTLSTPRNTQYAARTTNKGRRIMEIYLEFS